MSSPNRTQPTYVRHCTGRSNSDRACGLLSDRCRARPGRAVPRLRPEGDRAARPARVGGGAVPDRPAARDGRARAARHADPRAVGRHRHVDGRVRGGASSRSGSPTSRSPRRCRRTSRSARCRSICSATTSSASGGCARSPRARLSAPSGSPSPRPARTRAASAPAPTATTAAGGSTGRRPSSPTPAPTCPSASPCWRAPSRDRRQEPTIRAASWSRKTRPASRWDRRCAASAGAASTPASCSSTTSGCPDDHLIGDPDLGLSQFLADARGRPHLDRGAVAEPHPGGARPRDRARASSGCSSASRSRSSRRCSSSSPTSPPSSRRRAG